MNFLLQTSTAEAFTRLQQTIGLISVNVGVAIAAFLLILKTYNDIKLQVKATKQAAQELLSSKDEIINSKDAIVSASDRNYEAIKANTAVTEKQAVEIQKHLVDRIRRELIPLSQRLGRLESHLFSDNESGSAPTQSWGKDDEDSNPLS